MERRGDNAVASVVEWRISRIRVLVAVLCFIGFLTASVVAFNTQKPEAIAPLFMFALFIVIGCLICARHRIIRADATGVTYTGWLGGTRSVSRDKILGVLPVRSRWDQAPMLVQRDSVRFLGLGSDMHAASCSQPRAVVESLFGLVPLRDDLQPSSPIVMDVRARLERGETLEWRHRHRHMMGMFGVGAIGATALLLLAIPFWVPWLIGANVIGNSMLPATYAVSAIVAIAILTCLDMLRGGPVVRLRIDRDGLTLCRWWREEKYPASILRASVTHTQLKTHVVEVSAATRPMKRTWRFIEKQWRTPPGQLAAALLHVCRTRDDNDVSMQMEVGITGEANSPSPTTA